MLEKIGLPAKPSLRGNNWVVDASHCQGCSSQFTFINRKHHCRRCGGLFCSSCTQQKMYLRGQGDSPVRVCEPCKKLEEAARFEMRHGHKNRIVKGGGSKLDHGDEDEVLSNILGNDGRGAISSRQMSSSSSSNIHDVPVQDVGEELLRSSSLDTQNYLSVETRLTAPEDLRQQAVEEKKKYRILKSEGKPDEALKAFKRGKALEKQAAALEIEIRKTRKKAALSSISSNEKTQNLKEDFGRRTVQSTTPLGKEKDDLTSELKELGWSDLDLRDTDKKPVAMTLEGELSTLIGEIAHKNRSSEKENHPVDKSEVILLKKKALALKREGKLTEAKEELKKAKILEKNIEEQEFLGGDEEDSDDELSSLIRAMDVDKKDLFSVPTSGKVDLNFDQIISMDVDNFELKDDDMDDPEITAGLKLLGWTEEESVEPLQVVHAECKENDLPELSSTKLVPKNKLSIQRELLAVKKKALALRREGKLDEAEKELKKGKVLEQQLEEIENSSKIKLSEVGIPGNNLNISATTMDLNEEEGDVTDQDLQDPSYLSLLQNLGWKDEDDNMSAKIRAKEKQSASRRNKGEIQGELLGLKRKSLALRQQGQLDEAVEVLKSASLLEAQLAEMEETKEEIPPIIEKRNEDGAINSSSKSSVSSKIIDGLSDEYVPLKSQNSPLKGLETKEEVPEERREMNEINLLEQEITARKRKAVWLKREGKLVEAKEELRQAKLLEQKRVGKAPESSATSSDRIVTNVSPAIQTEQSLNFAPKISSRDRFKLQQESLSHKRQALKLRREGKIQEAEAEFELAKDLESRLEDLNKNELQKPSPKESVGDLGVEDLLDPQLLSALREIGIEDGGGMEEPEVVKPMIDVASEKMREERVQLEERIKAEKVKAVNLKRSGKQAEAMDALRRAKLLEKKLSSLGS